MKIFGLSRSAAACAAAGLFVWAQAAGVAQALATQTFLPRPQQVVITKTDAYLPGPTQMIASANADEVFVHPQGRYALIVQKEAALPPSAVTGKADTGAIALLLYDARLRKTRTLWQRRADGGMHSLSDVAWLPGTDCALAISSDTLPSVSGSTDPGTANDIAARGESTSTSTLLSFNFEKSLVPRVLATASEGFVLNVSPTKPLFVVRDNEKIAIGNALRGTLGPFLQVPSNTFFLIPLWNTEGTSIFLPERIVTKAAPDAKPEAVVRWYEWDGTTPNATALNAQPTKAMLAPMSPPPPLPPLPVALRTTTFSLPSPTPLPQAKTPAKPAAPTTPATILHPLYLEATDTPAATSYHSALIAPDTEEAFLLADQSAVLYQSGGALYAVPLVRLNRTAYAQMQKAQALQNAKQVGVGILMYSQDYDEEFPLQTGFPDAVGPYLKNDAAFQGFTYLRPAGPLASIASPKDTVIGYLAAPGGRAVVYVDGHVVWEERP